MNIAFIASGKPAVQLVLQQLIDQYGQSPIDEAEYVVALGGDGTALRALHSTLPMAGKPVFAMRLQDSLGALANQLDLRRLPERLQQARRVQIHPLKAEAQSVSGAITTVLGINEIVLMRQRLQAAKLHVRWDGAEHGQQITADGILFATPVGSTGYNRSAGGPILPFDSALLAVTGLAVCRPSGWSSAVLSDRAIVDVDIMDPERRPVRLETDIEEHMDVSRIRISCSHDLTVVLLLEEHGYGRGIV